MSLTPQRLRTESKTPTSEKSKIKSGNWSKCFPTKFSTETSSCTFVKKLLTVAVSNITYLRSMFPEQAYANRSMDGLPLKILKGKNDCPEAQNLANWLLGAFDALEKKYLRELMLILYKDQDNPDIVEEVYTFQFSYPDGQATCQLVQGQEGKKTITADDIYKSTQNLLRTLIVLTQGMDPLADTMMTMKLTYYDAVTPSDYEPAGFVPTPLVEPQLPAGSVVLKSGQVSTLYHSVQLGVRAHQQVHQVEEDHREEDGNLHGVSSSAVASQPLQAVPSQINQNTSYGPSSTDRSPSVQHPSQAPSSTSLLSRPSPSHPSSSSSRRSYLGVKTPQSQPSQAASSTSLLSEQSEQDSSISCLCTNTHPDPLMLQCSHCSYLQHAACYRILTADNIPTQHCCVSCSIEQGVPCTDTKLVKMSSKPSITLTCLFRRVLSLLLQVDMVTTELVVEKLGVVQETAVAVLEKLVADGCLVESEEEFQWKVLEEVLVNLVLPKYIGRKGGKISNKDTDKDTVTEVKSSMVADKTQVPRSEVKRSLVKDSGEEGTSRRLAKRKKVSEVKGNLLI